MGKQLCWYILVNTLSFVNSSEKIVNPEVRKCSSNYYPIKDVSFKKN